MSLLDLRQFALELADRRNKAALLLTPDVTQQRAYAEQVARAIGGEHLDILDQFTADENLAAALASFSMDDLLSFIGKQKARFLVVSGIEFLLAAWLSQGHAKQVKLQLCEKIEFWQADPPFLLVTHHDPVLAAYEAQRFTGGPVVIQMSQTLALE